MEFETWQKRKRSTWPTRELQEKRRLRTRNSQWREPSFLRPRYHMGGGGGEFSKKGIKNENKKPFNARSSITVISERKKNKKRKNKKTNQHQIKKKQNNNNKQTKKQKTTENRNTVKNILKFSCNNPVAVYTNFYSPRHDIPLAEVET